tara:strand:- start:588 stop:1490 length:903 start_codon:yes stop_codon:yes gene_type:complete
MTKKPTPISNRLIDTRVQLLHKFWGDTPKLYNHAILCSVGLPYRNPGMDVRVFSRTSGNTSLRLEAGALPMADGSFQEIGLPYGPRARLLLLHLCSEAIFHQSPIIEVEDSFTAFARSLGLATSGRNLRTLRDQVSRMSAVSMRLAKSHGSYVDVFQGPIFSKLRAEFPADGPQLQLWPSFVEFSPDFYESLRHHAVPLRKEAVGALKHSARALDVYVWLAHRLCRVSSSKSVRIRWTTLRFQFGRRDQKMESFKRAFKTALKQVLMVYPEAKVEIVNGGLCLHRSPPPITKKRPKRLLA